VVILGFIASKRSFVTPCPSWLSVRLADMPLTYRLESAMEPMENFNLEAEMGEDLGHQGLKSRFANWIRFRINGMRSKNDLQPYIQFQGPTQICFTFDPFLGNICRSKRPNTFKFLKDPRKALSLSRSHPG
jgi:hypothetical protein